MVYVNWRGNFNDFEDGTQRMHGLWFYILNLRFDHLHGNWASIWSYDFCLKLYMMKSRCFWKVLGPEMYENEV